MIWFLERLEKQDGARQARRGLLDFGRLHIEVELANEASSSPYESGVAMFLLFYKLLLDATGRSPGTWPSPRDIYRVVSCSPTVGCIIVRKSSRIQTDG